MPLDLNDLTSKSEPPSEEMGQPSSEDEGKLDNRNCDDVCRRCRGCGKRKRSLDREDNQVSSENEGANRGNDERRTNLENGHRIDDLFISKVEIGKGSHGTTVFEGTFGRRDGEKRPVAVKRLVQGHNLLAQDEIKYLIAFDKHPNIIRYFTEKSDENFLYLALELCDFSLDDLIQAHADSSVRDAMQYRKLLWADGRPSPLLLDLMRDIVSGLVHLHDNRIIHRDLNPRNVLITKHPSLCAKLSDMGISKCLPRDKSSMGYPASGSGTSGWQAPEQLSKGGSQTCRMDMFNLGCLLFFCLTGGSHPFGRDLERDLNIEENNMDLSSVEFMQEAYDLISRLLNHLPELRPKASDVLRHPFFWSSEERLSFLCDLSDRVHLEKWTNSGLLKALQETAPVVFDRMRSWTKKIEPEVMKHLNKYRTYDGGWVADLLRAVRNKRNHLQESPKEVQDIIKDVEGYFTGRFPSLLMESYKVAFLYCRKEKDFKKYFCGKETGFQKYFSV